MKIEYKFPSHRQIFSEKKRENREILPRFLKMPTNGHLKDKEYCIYFQLIKLVLGRFLFLFP